MPSNLDRLLNTLSLAPDTEIKAHITPKFKRLIGCDSRVVATELRDIFADCEKGCLASKYALWLIENAAVVAETKDD